MSVDRTYAQPTAIVTRSGERVTCRSRLEARWATYFDIAGLNWTYEPVRFELDNGLTYTPDFFVEGIGYFEIKPTFEHLVESEDRIARFIALGGADRVYLISSAMDETGKGFVSALHGTPLQKLRFPALEANLILGGRDRMELAKRNPEVFQDSMQQLLDRSLKQIELECDTPRIGEIMQLPGVLPHTVSRRLKL
jgi:hypothetical protein